MNEQYLGVNGQMVTVDGKAIKMPQAIGDMQTSVYDPQGKQQDIFKFVTDEIAKIPAPDVSSKLDKTGDGSNVTAAFTAASTRANIATGEKLSVLFGKIMKWFADLGSLAFKSTVAKSDLASDVQTSLGKADSALQTAPVTSVNGQIGDVEISADNVFAIEVDPTSSTPVVNKSFGEIKAAVQAGKLCVLTDGQLLYYCRSSPSDPMTSTIKFEIAVAIAARTYIGTININTDNTITRIYNDLIVSNNITEQNLVNTETTPTKNGAINWVYG